MSSMKKSRRKFTAEFKVKVAIEAIKERDTLKQLAERFELHANQISLWKQEFLDNATGIFQTEKSKKEEKEKEETNSDELFSKIGRLEVENDFLKKNLKKLGHL